MTGPLLGLRVLEIARWLAAPSCAAPMADLGAEVIEVPPPPEPMPTGGCSPPCWEPTSYTPPSNSTTAASAAWSSTWNSRMGGSLRGTTTNLSRPRLERYALTDGKVRGPAPDLGQHTTEVFEELGVSPVRLMELAASGIFGSSS